MILQVSKCVTENAQRRNGLLTKIPWIQEETNENTTKQTRGRTRSAQTAAFTVIYENYNKSSSSEDEIANVNFLDDIVHVEARAYAL